MTCGRCATQNLPGAALCVSCGAHLSATGPGGYPPPTAAGYPPPGYYPAQAYYPPPGYYPPPPAQRTSGMAIAGFVVSLVFCGLLGLILSIVGNNEVKRSNGTVGGGGLAVAGIVIGIIRVVIEALWLVAFASITGSAHAF